MPQSTGNISEKSNKCLCSGCKEVFSTVRNFDKHRVDINARRRNVEYHNVCVDPATVGLVISEETGVWISPQNWHPGE